MSEVNVFSEGLEQGAELETMYIPVYFDSLRGPLADVSPTKDQKGCGMGTVSVREDEKVLGIDTEGWLHNSANVFHATELYT